MNEHAEACEWCQATLHAAAALRDKRLGRNERRLLLTATSMDEAPATILPPSSDRNAQTATRRAVARLRSLGLIVVAANRTVRVTPTEQPQLLVRMRRKYLVLRFMWRTPLGDEVVRRYRSELERGERIRWMLHLEAVRDAAIARCPRR